MHLLLPQGEGHSGHDLPESMAYSLNTLRWDVVCLQVLDHVSQLRWLSGHAPRWAQILGHRQTVSAVVLYGPTLCAPSYTHSLPKTQSQLSCIKLAYNHGI